MEKYFEIIYEDNHIIVVNKAPGLLVQGDISGDVSLFSLVKEYIKEKYNKPGNVYLGLVHRLDRPTSGLVILARTSKAAKRLSEQFRDRLISKTYSALVFGKTPKKAVLKHKILRQDKKSIISKNIDSKDAHLEYTTEKHYKTISKISIKLLTGRHHQIRVQLAHTGYPIIGDTLYGSRTMFIGRNIALHAEKLTILHPTKKVEMTFFATPKFWPKNY